METRRSCRAWIVCLAFAAAVGASPAVEAAVCSVNNLADSASVAGTLRWCVGQVNLGVYDQIAFVQAGLYGLETPLQIDRDVDITTNVGVAVLPGEAFQDDTLLRIGCGTLACAPVVSITSVQFGSGTLPGFRAIDVRGGSVLTLDHVLLEGFDNTLDGGALRAQTSTLVHLVDSRFAENRGGRGGAVFSSGTLLEVIGSRFQDNRSSGDGGAIHFRVSPSLLSGQLLVDTSEFTGNSTTAGGGAVYVTGLQTLIRANVTSSSFSGNSSAVRGGALDGYADISLSTFASNRAPVGGALSLAGQSLVADSLLTSNVALQGGGIAFRTTSTTIGLTLKGSTLGHNNFEQQNGGIGAGVYLSGGVHLIENSTLSGNGDPGTVMAFSTSGGGLALVGGARAELRHATLERNAGDTGGGVHVNSVSSIVVSSSIVADSQIGTDCSFLGTYSQTTSLSTDASCGFTYRAAPLLGPLAQNGGNTPTHLPALGGPAINVATCFSALDQRGKPRPAAVNTPCDIGSVEAR